MQGQAAIMGRRITAALLAAALAAVSAATVARAGPLLDAAREAESKAAAGDAVGAYDTIRDAFGAFSMTLPFSVGKAVFVSERPKAYGAYSPRPEPVFKPGEPLITYVELIGLTWKSSDDSLEQANFSVDFEISEPDGKILAAQKNFGEFTSTGLVRNQELFTHLTLDITGAEPGDYLLKYTINDLVGKRFTSFEQKFTVRDR
ncbi:unnamed protein product [Ciceribacter sp. T2.26MG-112.2]|uniref:hypothetical protein n=1 Tax=Ciceribacter sp. T2.26MG-112.2 TaxID=3137154 RepID=UPI000E12760F|nr:hypothetical protein [Ciceribacter naphthalenivorans]SSC73533.1 unnamed protein product [Ciceribacter naphthalenivorans]